MTQLPPSPFISVSPGEPCSPLPSGEVEPSVTLAFVSGEFSSCGLDSSQELKSSGIDDGHTLDGSQTVAAPRSRLAGIASGPHDSISDTQYIPELFSVFAARRCMDLISPPLPKVERNIDNIALNAVGVALNIHPRDLDDDPPPLFLRKPRPAFLRALFELGGAR